MKGRPLSATTTVEPSIQFPCHRLPEDTHEVRLLGLYTMKEEGRWMQRIRIPGGRITTRQWRAVADLAARYTPESPLHLTTRQGLEVHGVWSDDVPAVQAGLAAVGLTTVGGCGDTPRNMTMCPCGGLCPGTCDMKPLADAIQAAIDASPWCRDLPRKFKISLSGCAEACARPWINDLGLVARDDGAFRVIAGASLGVRPATGIVLYDHLAPEAVVPLVVAVLRLFHAEGDRHNRGRARLRYLREKLGEAAFRQQVDALMREELDRGIWPAPTVVRGVGRARRVAHWRPPLGDVTPAEAKELADAVDAAGATLRIGLEHDLLVFGRRAPRLREKLEERLEGPRLVACPGTALCTRGLADSRGLARRLRDVLRRLPDITVNVSGCPSACPQAPVADIGLVGRVKTINGKRQDCYRLIIGGGNGRGPQLGEQWHPAVPAEAVPEVVEQLIDAYLAEGEPGESFARFARRAKEPVGTRIVSWLSIRESAMASPG